MTTAILEFCPAFAAGVNVPRPVPARAERVLALSHPMANGHRLHCHWQVEDGRLTCHWGRDGAHDPPADG